MVPVGIQNYAETLSSAAAAATLPTQTPFRDRLAALLEFVDDPVLEETSTTSCTDTRSALERVNRQHCDDFETAKASYLEVEESGAPHLERAPFSFDRIGYPAAPETGGGATVPRATPTLAIRSTEPILDAGAVKALRQAAEDVWQAEHGSAASTSRFTYQYSGNSEAHVFDFLTTAPNSSTRTGGAVSASAGSRAVFALNEALHTKIYPAIREAFFHPPGDGGSPRDGDDAIRLFVYDALVIRYNAAEAAAAATAAGVATSAAGQPLHRDLGLVSVNVMLSPAAEFEGGGTFFEHQLLAGAETPTPLHPAGAGYCLAHAASERHAGAGTTKGVRDILVLFVSAADIANSVKAPMELLSARLKGCRELCQVAASEDRPLDSEENWKCSQASALLCRILHQRLAVTAGPAGRLPRSLLTPAYCDGEALQYLGTALMDYAGVASHPHRTIALLEAASECFEIAALVTPCDARVYNNLGIVLGRIDETKREHGLEQSHGTAARKTEQQEQAYRKGLDLLQRSSAAGCNNDNLRRDVEATTLNYGLCVANQDRFCEAAAILRPLAHGVDVATKAGRDARGLWKYCRDRCEN